VKTPTSEPASDLPLAEVRKRLEYSLERMRSSPLHQVLVLPGRYPQVVFYGMLGAAIIVSQYALSPASSCFLGWILGFWYGIGWMLHAMDETFGKEEAS
jgi:hypothetical protein